MAQLKNTIIQGSARVTDTLYSTAIQTGILNIPTTAGGSTYGPGSSGQYLKTNGSTVYWDSFDVSDITNGILPITKGGTGQTSAANIFTAFSSSTNTLSITILGQTRTASAVNSVSNTWTAGTTAGPTIKTTVNGVAGTAVAIPSASSSASGAVTTGAQSFAGVKTFENTTASTSTSTGGVIAKGGIGVAGQVTALRLAANGSNTSYSLYVNGTSLLTGNTTINGVTYTKNIIHRNSNAVQDGSWQSDTRGVAPTATTDDSGNTTYSGAVLGTNILYIGNNKNYGNNSTGVNDNAKGYLRIYGSGSGYGELTYNDSMFSSTKSLYLSTSANSGISNEVRGITATNDYWRVAGGATAANSGYMEIATADDANEPIYVRQYSGAFTTVSRTLTLLDASGNTIIPGTTTHGGNVVSDTTNTDTLGTSSLRWKALYIGTADSYGSSTQPIYWSNGVPTAITGSIANNTTGSAAKLTTARTISVGAKSNTFDGSANISFATADMGIIWSDVNPIASKTYTGVTVTGNSDPAGYLYFFKACGTGTYYDQWHLTYRVTAYCAGQNDSKQTSIVHIDGVKNTSVSTWVWNSINNTSYRPYYQHAGYFCSSSGPNSYAPIVGLRFYSSYDPTNSTYARTITFEILQADNCEVTFFNAGTLYSAVSGTGSTNFNTSRWAIDGYTQGMTMTGDRNDGAYYTRDYNIYAKSAITAGNVIVGNSSGYEHLKNGNSFDITYPVLFAGSTLNSGSTGNNNFIHHYAITITTTQSGSYTSYKAVYIKGTLNGVIFTPISTTPLVQTISDSDNGYYFYYIGRMYNTTAMTFDTSSKEIYYCRNGVLEKTAGGAIANGTVGTLAYFSASDTIGSYTNTVGGTLNPIYLNAGVPTASNSSLGSATKPIYMLSGTITVGSSYAGGTAVTLNGTSKAASTASFYAPTSAGTSGYVLTSSGSGEPSWTQTLAASNLPTMYWANVAISSSSSTTTAPTVSTLLATTRATIGASSLNTSYALAVTGKAYISGLATIGTLDGGQHIINGNLQLNAQSGSYNEGLRINRSTTGYANIYLGGSRSSASGNQTGGWWIGTLSTPADSSSTGDSITNTVFTISNNNTADTLSIKGTRGATIGTNSGWAIRPRLAVGTTYNTSYTLYISGTSYFTGNSTFHNIYHQNSNSIQDGSWQSDTRGVAPTATTDSDGNTTYSGAVLGTNLLYLGNNKIYGNNSNGVNDNAQGYIRIYSSGSGYSQLESYTLSQTFTYASTGLELPYNKMGLVFRPDSTSYTTRFSYQNGGNEALVMATQNAVTSFIFINGESYTNDSTSTRWQSLTPALQIKNNSVYIGSLIANGVTPSYKFYVNGTSAFTDTLNLYAGAYSASTSYSYHGGGYVAVAKPNIRMLGDSTYGISTIEFTSAKGDTSVNKPSDCAFIQFQPYGSTPGAIGTTAPTLNTSGENNRLIIGINNDATDILQFATPSVNGIYHTVGSTVYYIPSTNGTSTTAAHPLVSTTTAGLYSVSSYALSATVAAGTQYGVAYYTGTNAIGSTAAGTSNYVLLGKGSAAPAWTAPKDTLNMMINALDTGSSVLTSNDYIITQYVGGGTTTTTYHRRAASNVRVGGLTTARKLAVALGSTTSVTFDGTADQTSIPVSGTLPIANGGTGAITTTAARANLGTAPYIQSIFYGVCSTAQATQAKEVTLTNGEGFSLVEGIVIIISFTYASASATMTLNVNSTGAKNLYQYGTTTMGNTVNTNGWRAGACVPFVYNGTGWERFFWENSTYSYMMPYTSTAAATAAKVASCWKFQLTAGKYFPLAIYYDNTYAGAITLNINSTGAKPVYINGSASSSSNYTLPGGIYMVYYNGTNYYLRTDSYMTGNITGSAATLTTARTIQTNLASTSSASFNGSANITPGVTGILPVTNGGTGRDAWNQGGILYASGTQTLASTTDPTNGYLLQSKGATVAPEWKRPTVWYGTCNTAAATTAKVVVCSDYDALTNGDILFVKFDNTNTGAVASLTLNVNSKGAKSIKKFNNGTITNLSYASEIRTGQTLMFTYNGTYWILNDSDYIYYGEALPETGVEGAVFYQLSEETYELPAGGDTGTLLMKNSDTSYDVTWSPSAVHISGSVLYGAAWNDYAEYREVKDIIEPGRVVIENGDDTLSLSTERMQPGAEIISDTFGFAIGETKQAQAPIAAAGRVLAYPNEPRESYKPGQPVCSGPNGTVSQMTNEEASKYPWLIIGTVSAIPNYETWGEDNIKVNGRIWIRIR